MAHDMFGEVVRPSVRVGTKQWYTVPVSVLTHSVGLGALIVVPLLATGTLPTPASSIKWERVLPVVPTPPPESVRVDTPPPPPLDVTVNMNAAPVTAPEGVKPEPPPRLAPIVGGLSMGPPIATTTLAAPKPAAAAPVPIGGDVRRPERIKYVDPIYPSIAKAARVSGTVIVEATIASDGSVRDAKVTRSIPMLDQAALDAVSQWRYTPTMLNRQPVEVIMSVTVTFAIN